jgi:hypothetical protein
MILDSCRHDTFAEAKPRNILGLGPLERRYTSATWTAPSHYDLLMGVYPHAHAPGRLAAEVYREGYARLAERLGLEPATLAALVPELWLPSRLQRLGFHTHALVSMPVLNASTPLNRGFDTYTLMPRRDDFEGMIGRLRFSVDRPSFVLLNLGETHYPYAGGTEGLPRLHGVHGVARSLDAAPEASASGLDAPLAPEFLKTMRDRQVEAVRRVDSLFPMLLSVLPRGCWLTVTADHGELFGEEGCFGHGPFRHPKVLEVPFVEGLVNP